MPCVNAHTFAKAAPDLVERIRKGEHRAFELFYRMEFLNLVHFSDSYLSDPEKARDIAQEALLALWENRSQLDPARNLRSYVFTVARHKTVDELRRRKFAAPSEEIDSALECLQEDTVNQYINALELSALMEKVWKSLPEKIGRTISLSRDEGLKNREIALRDGVSEKTVEYRIRVALGQFKKILKLF